MIKSERRKQIEAAISNNVAPTRSKSTHDLLLRLGNNRYAKLYTKGRTTPAGRFYFAQTQTTPESYDIEGTVVQRGASEHLLLNGKARLLRRLTSGNDYSYTRLGRTYYSQKEVQYLVHVPAFIKKAHSKGKGRELQVPHNAFMDSDLRVSANLGIDDQKRQLKSKVLKFMQTLPTHDGKPILYLDSDPVIYNDMGVLVF